MTSNKLIKFLNLISLAVEGLIAMEKGRPIKPISTPILTSCTKAGHPTRLRSTAAGLPGWLEASPQSQLKITRIPRRWVLSRIKLISLPKHLRLMLTMIFHHPLDTLQPWKISCSSNLLLSSRAGWIFLRRIILPTWCRVTGRAAPTTYHRLPLESCPLSWILTLAHFQSHTGTPPCRLLMILKQVY